MPRHQLTIEEKRLGGRNRVYNQDGSYREDFLEMCSKGFEATCIAHPFYARKHLKNKIKQGSKRA